MEAMRFMNSIPYRLKQLMGKTSDAYLKERFSSSPGYWGERILSQLAYAYEISKQCGHSFDPAIQEALSCLEGRLAEDGAIAKNSVYETEKRLSVLAEK